MHIFASEGETVSPLVEPLAVISKVKHCSPSVKLSLLMGIETHCTGASSDINTSPIALE